jgi:hypothetical protein
MIQGATYEATKARRLIRVCKRACPELKQAFEKGELSLRQYDLTSRLSVRGQRRALAAKERERRATVTAATVITEILDGENEVCLGDVAREIAARIKSKAPSHRV